MSELEKLYVTDEKMGHQESFPEVVVFDQQVDVLILLVYWNDKRIDKKVPCLLITSHFIISNLLFGEKCDKC